MYDMASDRVSKVISLSVPPDAAADFERIAAEEGRNRSELFREMLRVYEVQRHLKEFERLQRIGAASARRLGIRDEADVERLIHELRGVQE